MAISGEIYRLVAIFVSLCFMLPGVKAMDEGDAIAVLLGVVITVVGFCACLGYYARKREGHL
ncbi:small integral membrane protein 30 [Spea bombifrons]|uniref:small integral membrane protein 30 n=1 Tax=Spea bombifrons TaxID=233779 RepID=UPI00234AD582|nr:small integral membrane protein 30 [Spea bombifrons]XP_053321525.1 small integral membrane protein 30 [Spea bombifrons]XP_053321526.1 small integral membrane protein 30 [Spea bombifrons]XP_053321527.1 small integral membrane protein 30 [Spea bombifrons]